MHIKIILLTTFLAFSHWVFAQTKQDSILEKYNPYSYKHAVGFRFSLNGGWESSLNYKYFVNRKIAFEVNTGTILRSNGIYHLTGILMGHGRPFQSKGLRITYGLGVSGLYIQGRYMHYANYWINRPEKGRAYPGVSGLAGFEYQFKKSRFVLGSDARLTPYFFSDASRGGGQYVIKNIALNFKYIIKK